MPTLTPYLFFDGSCREALGCYKTYLGGELELMSYGQAQGDACKLGDSEKIIHGTLQTKQFVLMASDRADAKPTRGDNVSLSLRLENKMSRAFATSGVCIDVDGRSIRQEAPAMVEGLTNSVREVLPALRNRRMKV